MTSRLSIHRLSNYLVVLSWIVFVIPMATGQTKPSKQDQADDVIRVDTTLVQTDVMVFDKQGYFVDGLRADQFELKIDNKPQPIAFFERVASAAGSQREDRKSQPTIGASGANTSAGSATTPSNTTRGRTLIFFMTIFTWRAVDHGPEDVRTLGRSSGLLRD